MKNVKINNNGIINVRFIHYVKICFSFWMSDKFAGLTKEREVSIGNIQESNNNGCVGGVYWCTRKKGLG